MADMASRSERGPLFVRARDIERMFSIPVRTLNELVREGRVTRHRVGTRVVLYSVEELEQVVTRSAQQDAG